MATTEHSINDALAELLRDQAGDMKVLLSTQTTAQNNLQRLPERVAEKL